MRQVSRSAARPVAATVRHVRRRAGRLGGARSCVQRRPADPTGTLFLAIRHGRRASPTATADPRYARPCAGRVVAACGEQADCQSATKSAFVFRNTKTLRPLSPSHSPAASRLAHRRKLPDTPCVAYAAQGCFGSSILCRSATAKLPDQSISSACGRFRRKAGGSNSTANRRIFQATGCPIRGRHAAACRPPARWSQTACRTVRQYRAANGCRRRD